MSCFPITQQISADASRGGGRFPAAETSHNVGERRPSIQTIAEHNHTVIIGHLAVRDGTAPPLTLSRTSCSMLPIAPPAGRRTAPGRISFGSGPAESRGLLHQCHRVRPMFDFVCFHLRRPGTWSLISVTPIQATLIIV